MFDINKFTTDLAGYVANGALTRENAEAVYEAACAKYGFDPETGEPIEESTEVNYEMTLEAALDELKDKFDDVKDAAEKKVNKVKKDAVKNMIKKDAEKKIKNVKDDIEDATDAIKDKFDDVKDDIEDAKKDLKAKFDKVTSEENKQRAKIAAKKAAPIVAAATVASAVVGTGAYKLLSASEKKSLKDIEGLRSDLQTISGQWIDGKIPNTEYKSRYDKLYGMLKDKEHASALSKVKSYMKFKSDNKKRPDKYKSESAYDLINEFLEERALESLMAEAEDTAPAEANPATHVEDEIDEKLPAETPNEPTPIGCVKDIEDTDKAIEDAKKALDVVNKLAEMKSAHEAEKDTTQQHEVIKQALESEDAVKLTKLNIYESADAGIITEEEKKELLDILNVIED